MKKELFFRVKYGFNASDQVSIPEQELEKALYAQIKGIPVQLGNAFINGRNIISITPHWHKHTGWYDWYEPQNGEDWVQIKRDCPNYDGVIEKCKQKINFLLQTGQEKLIGKNAEIKELDMPKDETAVSKLADGLAKKFKI